MKTDRIADHCRSGRPASEDAFNHQCNDFHTLKIVVQDIKVDFSIEANLKSALKSCEFKRRVRERRPAHRARLGCGQMGSTLMGSLQKYLLFDGLVKRYALALFGR